MKILNKLSGQPLLDVLIELAYSEDRSILSDAEYCHLAFPDLELAEELYKAAAGSEGDVCHVGSTVDKTRWHCECGPGFIRVDTSEFTPEELLAWLPDELSMKRVEEILDGEPLTEDEATEFRYYYLEFKEGELDTPIVVFRTSDSQDRGLSFSAQIGKGGEIGLPHGPFTDDENPLTPWIGKEYVFFWGDQGVAITPECAPEGECNYLPGPE